MKPNVALLLGTASTWAPFSTDASTRSSNATSQQIVTPTFVPAMSTTPGPVPGTKYPARST